MKVTVTYELDAAAVAAAKAASNDDPDTNPRRLPLRNWFRQLTNARAPSGWTPSMVEIEE